MSDDVSRYYDENTKPFLRRGQGGAERVIHRAVWGEGVGNRHEAFHFVHELIRRELVALQSSSPRVLDLGCGVGATLRYLLERCEAEGFGITNSERQVEIARASGKGCFLLGDFCRDPLPDRIDLAYGIESFVHGRDADAFFANVSAALRSGGRLVLVDDFLAGDEADAAVREFARGWHARSLLTPGDADAKAAGAGLVLRSDRDLTSHLELDRPRDWAIAAFVALARGFYPRHARRPKSARFDSLSGGDALRKCLKRGLVTYRIRVYDKREVS
jgi:SAM-dependent methyltransferase